MSTPGNSTLKQALDMGDGDRPEDRLHKLVGYLNRCTACSPKVKAEFLKKAAALKPDLIILDVIMDDATEGFHTACKFRGDAALKHTPILMLTSVNETSPQKFSAKDGEFLPVDAFMEKPVKPKEFVAKVTELLALKKEQINVEGRRD